MSDDKVKESLSTHYFCAIICYANEQKSRYIF